MQIAYIGWKRVPKLVPKDQPSVEDYGYVHGVRSVIGNNIPVPSYDPGNGFLRIDQDIITSPMIYGNVLGDQCLRFHPGIPCSYVHIQILGVSP